MFDQKLWEIKNKGKISLYHKKYYRENKKKLKQQNHDLYINNRKRYDKTKKIWYHTKRKPETIKKMKLNKQQYGQTHRTEINKAIREWYQRNKEHRKLYMKRYREKKKAGIRTIKNRK